MYTSYMTMLHNGILFYTSITAQHNTARQNPKRIPLEKSSKDSRNNADADTSRLPELQLASMNLAALRQLGRQLRLWGYAGDSRDRLTTRLLTRIKRHTKSGNAL